MKADWWAGATKRQWYLRDARQAELFLDLSTNMITVRKQGIGETIGQMTLELFIRNEEPENTHLITEMWDNPYIVRHPPAPNNRGVIRRLVEIAKERIAC